MPTFLHLPFELQAHILQSAFLDALDTDLSSLPARALSASPTYHPTIQRSNISLLSPIHRTTSIHDLFTQLLPLIISPCVSDANSEADCDSDSDSDNDSELEVTMTVEDDLTVSPNQLIHCLRQSRNLLITETEATKLEMRDIVLRQPWARAARDTYCTLWRRKERAEVVGEVIEAALKVCRGLEGEDLEMDMGGVIV